MFLLFFFSALFTKVWAKTLCSFDTLVTRDYCFFILVSLSYTYVLYCDHEYFVLITFKEFYF